MSADEGPFSPTARIIADSVSPQGVRLTTMEVRFHRFVLAEFNTHRSLSRNSASSRAIPVSATMRMLAETPALPLVWASEQRGMQGGADMSPATRADAELRWLAARDDMVGHAEHLVELGVHKSVVNRLLEPFLAHTVIVSATDWAGFFAQRCSPLAQPEIQAAADCMRAVYETSKPEPVAYGHWHLPYLDDAERAAYGASECRQISAARCARVSYLTHDGQRDPERDMQLYDRLVSADPPHASPLEHVATPAYTATLGNFTGWRQLRHEVLGF